MERQIHGKTDTWKDRYMERQIYRVAERCRHGGRERWLGEERVRTIGTDRAYILAHTLFSQ